jgi:hypothetical protein
VPENYVKFKPHFCLAQNILYSPFCLKQIRKLIADKICYIVPGKSNEYDYKLSALLSIPILCGDPAKISHLSTKSGAKEIFKEAGIPVPVGASHIRSKDSFYAELSRLIAHNLFVPGWIFKIDNEFGGRGHAWLQVDQIKNVLRLRKEKLVMTNAIVNKLRFVVETTVPKKAKVAMPGVFRTWTAYLERFCQVGGVIEAMPHCAPQYIGKPSISLLVEPDGQIQVHGAYDKFEATRFVNAGMFSPQTSLPGAHLNEMGRTLGRLLYRKGVFGFLTIDFVSFPDPTDPAALPLFWGVDINPELTDNG